MPYYPKGDYFLITALLDLMLSNVCILLSNQVASFSNVIIHAFFNQQIEF